MQGSSAAIPAASRASVAPVEVCSGDLQDVMGHRKTARNFVVGFSSYSGDLANRNSLGVEASD